MKHFVLILILVLSSCGSSPKEETGDKNDPEKKETAVPKQIIGRIASVSTTGGFVLIQKYSLGSMPINAIIQSTGPDNRQASLKPSGQRVRNFFAADIVNGEVEIGDAVVAYYDQQKEDDTAPMKDEKTDENAESPPKKEESDAPKPETKN